MRQAEAYLKKLALIQPGIRVQTFIDFPGPWIIYPSDDFEDYVKRYGWPNHREILKDEIILDIDGEIDKDASIHGDMIEKRFKTKSTTVNSFTRWKSGGVGEHFSLIYPELSSIARDMIPIYRKELARYIVGKRLLHPSILKSHVCLQNKILIQLEYAKHRKGGIKKLISGKNNGENKIPKEVHDIVNQKTNDVHEIRKMSKKTCLKDKPNCIKFLEGEEFNGIKFGSLKDGYNRGLFFLVSFYRNSKDDEWLNNYCSTFIEDRGIQLNAPYKSMIKSNNGLAGCAARYDYLDELNCTHVCKNCSIFKKVFTEQQ